MELSDGVKQGRRRNRPKTISHARPLPYRISEAVGRDVLGAARDRTQCGPWWTFSASRLGSQTQAVALTTKGPSVSVLTHVEFSIGAPTLGGPC
jgi:hypothetical protein